MATMTAARKTAWTGLRTPALPLPSLTSVAFVASMVFAFLYLDAMIQARAFFDTWGLHEFQRIDTPELAVLFTAVNALTISEGAVAAWTVVLVVLVAARWWVPAMAWLVLPAGGVIKDLVAMLPDHSRPPADEFVRSVGPGAATFPSGHVLGAVLLYGLLFVIAGRIGDARLRGAVRGFSVAVIGLVGAARLWEGAHWPSDVLGAYSLGAVMLAALVLAYRRIDAAAGDLPLIRRGEIPHDEVRPHAHALTSVVLFDHDGTVAKVYSPGLLPRVLYWLSFQAPFPYVRNRAALEAAMARRNLAALLSEYWYGSSRVARVVRVGEAAGQPALVSEFVTGSVPADRRAVHTFLADLRGRFEQAGFPTWQINPRQPRAVDNVLETAPGHYTVIDLESGLVSPLASPREWARGIRRGHVPLFDTVHFDITRRYVEREGQEIRRALGEERYAELVATLDRAEETQRQWREAEPRLLGRFVGGFWSGWNYRAWPGRINRLTARGQAKVADRLEGSIDAWLGEGRITSAEAATLRAQVESPAMRAMMPHLGAHAAISIFLRFPFGSIARPAWTLTALLVDTGRLLSRRISRARWKESWAAHSPLVIALGAIPGFGAFAYVAAKPVRRNRLLVRAILDMLALTAPGGLYERSGLRRIIARPVLQQAPALPAVTEQRGCCDGGSAAA